MKLTVREMKLSEVDIRIDYFHNATNEYLDLLGVDPNKLPSKAKWRQAFEADFALPIHKKSALHLLWLNNDLPIGMSSVDTILFGENANMHLHILQAGKRNTGFGTSCVIKSAQIYFERLNLQRLYCQPNAFNIAPNRTLQKVGFKYVKTYMTIPGAINTHQAITQWVLTKEDMKRGETLSR